MTTTKHFSAWVFSLSVFLFSVSARADPPSWLSRSVVLIATRLALEHNGFGTEQSRGMASRARNAAWLPQVSVRVARNMGATTTQYAAASGDRQALDDSLFVDVRVSLALDRLVFDTHEVALLRMEQQRVTHRLRLEAQVLEALAHLEALCRTREHATSDATVDPAWELDYLRTRALIEQLTGAPIESLGGRNLSSPATAAHLSRGVATLARDKTAVGESVLMGEKCVDHFPCGFCIVGCTVCVGEVDAKTCSNFGKLESLHAHL
jgi:hypothetical protein